ncbi:MAG: hypothetical protein M1818_005171 [Claussenomyces sp. TS43310]|nr:MAG: hypothetical protein M1818_005171 [Claussenomyces sp. TS43310]
MGPLIPHWHQPSHPEIQQVIINEAAFTSKSLSKVALPPFGLFAKMTFPPCSPADTPSYSTVQMGPDTHLHLNSDLIFDMPTLSILAGPRGLRPGDELTFFYPSTEWSMAQGFDCLCGAQTCRGRIEGAATMRPEHLEGLWLNGYIREMLAQKAAGAPAQECTEATDGDASFAGPRSEGEDPVQHALKTLMQQAKASAGLAEKSLASYNRAKVAHAHGGSDHAANGHALHADVADVVALPVSTDTGRNGPTSRELSGEMGGDTKAV